MSVIVAVYVIVPSFRLLTLMPLIDQLPPATVADWGWVDARPLLATTETVRSTSPVPLDHRAGVVVGVDRAGYGGHFHARVDRQRKCLGIVQIVRAVVGMRHEVNRAGEATGGREGHHPVLPARSTSP